VHLSAPCFQVRVTFTLDGMTDSAWFTFFRCCAMTLGAGHELPEHSDSWCAWTNFSSLRERLHYWTAGLPGLDDLTEIGTADGGPWGQPFLYQDIAHIVVPREFYWEVLNPGEFRNGTKRQDLDALSRALNQAGVKHRCTELVLEIKLY
jgi:hypothetical protein